MTDHGILFSAPMIRALLAGRKTMTRRLAWRGHHAEPEPGQHVFGVRPTIWQKVRPGDRLWVRETLKQRPMMANFLTGEPTNAIVAAYAADDEDVVERVGFNLAPWWRGAGGLPAIHMPRSASRLTLTVTATKIEPLQAISYDDCADEGTTCPIHGDVKHTSCTGLKLGFQTLWESLHGAGSWNLNPELVAMSFTVERRNIDQEPS